MVKIPHPVGKMGGEFSITECLLRIIHLTRYMDFNLQIYAKVYLRMWSMPEISAARRPYGRQCGQAVKVESGKP
jgi:hypothetical protein